jgi:hypothetical protein
MTRRIALTVAAAGIGMAVAMTAGALAYRSATAGETIAAEAGQAPDTSSPRWKAISEDVGILTRDDDRLGLRGRMYVKVNGAWRSVAMDGPADAVTVIPTR